MTITIKRGMRHCVIPVIWAISGITNVIAQSAMFEAPVYTPYAREFLSRVIFENAISSTLDGLEVIPEGVRLELAFREVLQEKEYYYLIAPRDWGVLHSIPSPRDAQFISKNMDDLWGLCERYLDGTSTIVEATREYDGLRLRSEATITDRYKAIYDWLSPTTKRAIDEVRRLHEHDGRISYSVLNLAGIAELVPQYAERILDDKCISVFDSFRDFSPKKLALKEDVPTMVPLVAGENRVHVVEEE